MKSVAWGDPKTWVWGKSDMSAQHDFRRGKEPIGTMRTWFLEK